MAAETHRPDGQLSCVGLATCDFLEHDEDPDVSSVTINATGNNVNTEYGVDLPTPSANPTVGTDLQVFRAGVIEFDSGQTGTPDARIELWENGALVRAGPNTAVSVYAILNFTWDASELATADGSLVQCKVIGTKTGGSPTARNTTRIGHIEWNAEVSGALIVNVGLASETNTPLATGRLKTRSVGLAAETSKAVLLARNVGLAAETDATLAIARLKARAVGLASETDTALTVSRLKTALIGLATEADAALALVLEQIVAVGLAAEIDSAFLLARPVGIALETDASLAVGRLKARAVGLAAEASKALLLARNIGIAVETDAALAVGRLKTKAIGLAAETDKAILLARNLGLPTETDAALATSADRAHILGIAAEIDTALSFAVELVVLLGLVLETDVALAAVVRRVVTEVGDHPIDIGFFLSLKDSLDNLLPIDDSGVNIGAPISNEIAMNGPISDEMNLDLAA